MIKILFLIHDLGQGGAEKVLVNLVNHMDSSKFDISVFSLFGGGINEQFLDDSINYHSVLSKSFPGNSKIMKLLSPKQLHSLCIKDHYDIEISYLEGPCARIISGCQDSSTLLVSWIHVEQHDLKRLSASFRNDAEAIACYNRFDKTICVSRTVKKDFCSIINYHGNCEVLYNTVESERILDLSKEKADRIDYCEGCINLIAVGTLKESKGYLRLLKIIKRLIKESYKVKLYILGIGPQEKELKEYISHNMLEEAIVFLGYDVNPYKYVSKCDLFVCSSFAEGFSTAATEALIVGTPVCTVDVSGMKEMLGGNNEYGIVTENSEDALYEGIKMLLEDPELLKHYRRQAGIRGKIFTKENTVNAVEKMLLNL